MLSVTEPYVYARIHDGFSPMGNVLSWTCLRILLVLKKLSDGNCMLAHPELPRIDEQTKGSPKIIAAHFLPYHTQTLIHTQSDTYVWKLLGSGDW